jgi:hypothetical protein
VMSAALRAGGREKAVGIGRRQYSMGGVAAIVAVRATMRVS